MADSYCAQGDLYAFGLPRGAVPNPGRVVDAANASTDTIPLGEHGFATGDPVSFRADANGSLPAPLVEGVGYFAIATTDEAFSVSASPGGAVIDLTTAGEGIVVIAPLPIAGAIAWASRIIDENAPAHLVPFSLPVPEIVKMTCAELAAGKLLSGSQSKSLADMVDAAVKRLAKWAAGVPIRGENAPAPANLATSASVPFNDSRGWQQFGGIGSPRGGRCL